MSYFQVGDRVFSHYVMDWGTVEGIDAASNFRNSVWYRVRMDKGGVESLDDAGGQWEFARVIPPEVAERYGYGADPRAVDGIDAHYNH